MNLIQSVCQSKIFLESPTIFFESELNRHYDAKKKIWSLLLKMAESVYDMAVSRNVNNDQYFHRFHYENYGGTPVIGVAKPVIIGHGISNDMAFMNMIKTAEKMIDRSRSGSFIAWEDDDGAQTRCVVGNAC